MIELLLVLVVAAGAQERESELGPVRVFGGGHSLSRPLAPKTVDKRKVENFQFTDVNRALKQTSGVYAREEDGQGLRPNIGLRGTNPDRSKKITLLEDGVLIGPAPYSAPAAYFTPSMMGVESLEIYKGFAALPYGPNSIGGAIQYVTPQVPYEPVYKAQAGGGSFDTRSLKLSAGRPLPFGGFQLQGSRLETDGFKKIDGGGDAGFETHQLAAKLRIDLKGSGHNLLATYGFAEENSRETYVGLSDEDFDVSPFKRYSSTALDKMKWKHQKFQLRHQLPLSATSALETTFYQHRFHRNWRRLDRFRNSAFNFRDVLRDPTLGNAPYYDVLRGAADSSTLGPTNGQLILVNNDRTYLSEGVQSRFTREFSAAGSHTLEVFARIHADRIDRNHTSDSYNMTGGALMATGEATQADTDNMDKASGRTLAVIDNWDLGTWTLTPVLRVESADFTSKNHLTGETRERGDQVWLPGGGVTKKFGETLSARFSVNRAATLAGISTDGTERREEAVNYELEVKHADPSRDFEAGLVLFYNDYQNITGTCTASSACSAAQQDQIFNGGRAVITGAEAQAGKGFRTGRILWPVQMNLSLLKAEFRSGFQSTSSDWGSGTVQSGDPLPYIPAVQYSVSVGTEYKKWKQDTTITYQGPVYDQATADRREIPGHGVVDWVGSYGFSKTNSLNLKIDNVLAREYVAAARPYGLRPGKPRAFMVSLQWQL